MKTLTLKLNEAKPDSLKINRLGDYLKKLAALYGDADKLYLDSVKEGSACLNVKIDELHADQAQQRVLEASLGRGPAKYRDAYAGIVKLMNDDGYSGEVLMDDKKVVALPVHRVDLTSTVIEQTVPTSVKGKVYRVGGTDETVPVRLQSADGETIFGQASIELSKKLGASLYQYIHAHGDGVWVSEREGHWRLAKLQIESFELIERLSAKDTLKRLREIGAIKDESPERIHSNIFDYRG